MAKRGPKPGQANALPQDKIDEIFDLYCNRIPIEEIRRRVGVSSKTISKYRDEQDWNTKRQARWDKAAKKADDKYAEARARQINLAKMLQHKGLSRLKTLNDADISAAETRNFIKDGIQIERELTGDIDEDKIEIKVLFPDSLAGL